MSDLEFNKIFAAILVAGIVAMLSGFIADHLIHPEEPGERAYVIEGVESGEAGETVAKPAGPEPILALLAEADIEAGQKVAKACVACHTFEKGGAQKTGPNLWDVVGAEIAADPGYGFSSDLEQFGGNWDYANLNHWLWKPKDMVPGTKMNFIGLKKPEDRANLIAWMRTQGENPPPLPSEEEIQAEIGEPGEEGAPAEAGQEIAPEIVSPEETSQSIEEQPDTAEPEPREPRQFKPEEEIPAEAEDVQPEDEALPEEGHSTER